MNSIEKLTIETSRNDGEILSVGSSWELFIVEELTARTLPLVCAVGTETIIIYGGANEFIDVHGGIALNTVTRIAEPLDP